MRLQIGFFGRCNVGKSSLINAISGQKVALVSEVAGTTTDPVIKSMELAEVGAVVLIDTAGIDDQSQLGAARREQTLRAAQRCDVAVVVCGSEEGYGLEMEWIRRFEQRGVEVVVVLGKSDVLIDTAATVERVGAELGREPIVVSASRGEGVADVVAALKSAADKVADKAAERTILGNLVSRGDRVVLVMPQDEQAPKGRLILPEVQTIRELLDRGCVAVCCVPEEFEATVAGVPDVRLVVCDSQVFGYVAERMPAGVGLTSFSVLMACYKGNVGSFLEGARVIDSLTEQSRVLIAEACTHAPATEDIGRVKLPRMLRQRVGQGLRVDVVGGSDWPDDLASYDLIIHCGACMFNRRHVLSRLALADAAQVPMTNYGIAIAHLQGILGRVVWPTE